MTRPVCPEHGVREEAHEVERDGVRMIEFACPVEECERSWIVRRSPA